MRCRPDDIARIVTTHPVLAFMRDKLVTVHGPLVPDVCGFGPGWYIEGRLGIGNLPEERLSQLQGLPEERFGGEIERMQFPDAWLQPIRGDKGTDEMLLYAGPPPVSHDGPRVLAPAAAPALCGAEPDPLPPSALMPDPRTRPRC